MRVIPRDPEDLSRIIEEYKQIGFDVEKRGNEIVVHAIPREVKNPKKKDKNDRDSRGRGRDRSERREPSSK